MTTRGAGGDADALPSASVMQKCRRANGAEVHARPGHALGTGRLGVVTLRDRADHTQPVWTWVKPRPSGRVGEQCRLSAQAANAAEVSGQDCLVPLCKVA